ncbi:MAG: caspase family protein, partial [Candidatus Competibacteraceae bacterium]|nr:caspase family protein [Candidatus Competibacteraceae bacterium]
MSRHLLCAFLLVATLALGNSAHAALHALVIGIDDYQHGSDLFGAVNDAKDIAAALEQTGAASVRLLLNEQAHRDAIFSAWESLKAEAKSGDTLLLSYAGHGSQEPERVPGQEQDGMDEVLLLGAYDAKAPANYQRIVDDELRKMVLDAADFEVVMVFDACHSGTLNRAVGREVRQQRSRFSNYGAITNDTLPPPPLVQEPQAG